MQQKGLSGAAGAGIVLGAAVAGAVVTGATRQIPGILLGAFILAGALVAALVVRQRSLYLLLPVPALADVAAAVAVGLTQDPAARASRSALVSDATQWIGGGFVTMVAATVVMVAFVGIRWYLSNQESGGAGRQGPASRGGRGGRAGRPADPAPRGF